MSEGHSILAIGEALRNMSKQVGVGHNTARDVAKIDDKGTPELIKAMENKGLFSAFRTNNNNSVH